MFCLYQRKHTDCHCVTLLCCELNDAFKCFVVPARIFRHPLVLLPNCIRQKIVTCFKSTQLPTNDNTHSERQPCLTWMNVYSVHVREMNSIIQSLQCSILLLPNKGYKPKSSEKLLLQSSPRCIADTPQSQKYHYIGNSLSVKTTNLPKRLYSSVCSKDAYYKWYDYS